MPEQGRQTLGAGIAADNLMHWTAKTAASDQTKRYIAWNKGENNENSNR